MRRQAFILNLRLLLLSLCLLATLGIAATSSATVVQEGTLRVSIATQLKPYRLPRTDPAPIKVLIAGHVWTSTGAVPPQLTRMTVLINRHGELRPGEIPSCPVSRIRPATTAQAIERCGPALVGSGHFWASVVLPEQGVYHTTGRLLAFNGTQTVCSAPQGRSVPRSTLKHSWERAGDDARPSSTGRGSDRYGVLDSPSPSFSGRLRPRSSRTQGGRPGERVDARDPQAADRGQRNSTCRKRPEFLAQIYTTQPFPSSFVVPFFIHHIGTASCSDGGRRTKWGKDAGSEGRGAHSEVRDPTRATEDTAPRCVRRSPYGTELTGSLPQALGEWGFVNRIKMTLGREMTIEGKTHSYLRASCPAPKGTSGASFSLAQAHFSFATGEELSADVPKSCGVKE